MYEEDRRLRQLSVLQVFLAKKVISPGTVPDFAQRRIRAVFFH